MGQTFKILVTGPFNSGKTTFIGTISEIDVVTTERKTNSSGGTCNTTVAMDFGRITLRDGDVLHLYGTPGQERFDFMWELLSEGMLGYVVLIDGTDASSVREAARIMGAFQRISDRPFVVGLTRSDRKGCAAAAELAEEIGSVDVMHCDAREVKDVKKVLLALLEKVLEEADEAERAEAG